MNAALGAPGFARVSMQKRRAVTNHVRTVHAIAMCNLTQLAMWASPRKK